MTKSSDQSNTVSRRSLLRGAALTAGAAGAAAIGVAGAKTDAAAADQSTTGTGYRETEHVRRAYEAAGF